MHGLKPPLGFYRPGLLDVEIEDGGVNDVWLEPEGDDEARCDDDHGQAQDGDNSEGAFQAGEKYCR